MKRRRPQGPTSRIVDGQLRRPVPPGQITDLVLVQRLRELVWRRERKRCHYCQAKLILRMATLDHKIPQSKGGETSIENCVCACLDCNQLKADSDYDTFLQGPGLARLAGGGNGQGDRS